MNTTAVRLYGKNDLRLESFELPQIWEDELLVKIVTDSICMSTHKAVKLGTDHKRVPDNIEKEPIIVGHEFSGIIVEVGKKWADRYQPGDHFALQPTLNYKGTPWAPGYSYPCYGGACTYCVVPHEAVELNCILPYSGSFFEASLSEPMSCIVSAFASNYHTNPQNHAHAMGTKPDGNILILGGCGPMGLGAIAFALCVEQKPARVVVTDVDDQKLARAASILSKEYAKSRGIELHYVNTAKLTDAEAGLMDLTGGVGYDDVFLFVPIQSVAELGQRVLAKDGCLNVFAGPVDSGFSANVNLYNAHYNSTHILGACGGLTCDTLEVLRYMEAGVLHPSFMVTHVGGLNAYAQTVLDLPQIPGGKKLIYTHIDMPLTAISDFRKLGERDPFFTELADCCDANNGLWSAEAEQKLLAHYQV